MSRDARLVPIPPVLLEHLRGLLRDHGLPEACRRSKVSRSAYLGALARGETMPGTLSLIEASAARKSQAA